MIVKKEQILECCSILLLFCHEMIILSMLIVNFRYLLDNLQEFVTIIHLLMDIFQLK